MVDSTDAWLERQHPMHNRFRGVALSYKGGTEESVRASIARNRDAGLKEVSMTVTKNLIAYGGLLLEPLSPSIGTVVHNIDLAEVSDEQVAMLRDLWLQRKVLFFRGQRHLTREQHVAFASKFGDIGGTHGERENEPSAELTGKRSRDHRFNLA